LENGQKLQDPVYLAMYLECCGVPQETAKPLLELAQQPDHGFWARPHRKVLPDQLLTLIMNETAASTICNFEPSLIPGLAQTAGYAAEVMRGIITVDPEDVLPRVEARAARQALLSRPYPPQVTFFINESVLRFPVGGPQVMNEQLLHLVLLTVKPQIKVRIVPTAAGPHAAMRGSFMSMGYTDRRPVVMLETEAISTFVEDRDVVATYRLITSELHRIALDDGESRLLLADLASEYDDWAAEERERGGGSHLA
jgi:hypothetical protein